MKLLRFRQTLLTLATVCAGFAARAADSDAVGHWEGAIKLPGTELNVRVDLERKDAAAWTGTIDIPAQGLRGFKLGDVAVKDANVSFALPAIPGDPKFAGQLATDAQSISGNFLQSGLTFPFKIERKARPGAKSGETPSAGVPGTGLMGHWQGSMRPSPLIELRLVLDVSSPAPGKFAGVVISVDQGNARIPIAAVSESGGAVRLELPSIGSEFTGAMNGDGSEISGEWKQGGNVTPLVFRRLARAPDFSRPQDPKKPYPYSEEEVNVMVNADVSLAGTLTLPPGAGPYPAVVLVSGSGPQDRDEALMGHRPFLVLADHLTRAGIAVLRYDDRGIGKSKGDFAKATHEDFVDDALAAVTFLAGRKEIERARIGIIGHSEGGIVAPLAAVKSPDVAFIVLLAGVGVSMEELLLQQGEDIARVMGLDPERTAKNTEVQRAIFQAMRDGKGEQSLEKKLNELFDSALGELTEEQRKALGYSDAMRAGQMQMLRTPWFRKLLAYDPGPALRAVKCPVLALNGEKDLQVAAKENLAGIRAALTTGGNKTFEIIALPGRNHLFQKCDTGAIAEYGQIGETFDPEVLTIISDWIRKVSAAKPSKAP